MQQETEKRSEVRVPVSFPGTLTLDGVATACHIQNMCSRGFLIQYSEGLPKGWTRGLPLGQILHLKAEVYPRQFVECSVHVRHVNTQCVGARVVEMNEDDKRVCHRFLEEQRAALEKR